jgi:hypothetical protein
MIGMGRVTVMSFLSLGNVRVQSREKALLQDLIGELGVPNLLSESRRSPFLFSKWYHLKPQILTVSECEFRFEKTKRLKDRLARGKQAWTTSSICECSLVVQKSLILYERNSTFTTIAANPIILQ